MTEREGKNPIPCVIHVRRARKAVVPSSGWCCVLSHGYLWSLCKLNTIFLCRSGSLFVFLHQITVTVSWLFWKERTGWIYGRLDIFCRSENLSKGLDRFHFHLCALLFFETSCQDWSSYYDSIQTNWCRLFHF